LSNTTRRRIRRMLRLHWSLQRFSKGRGVPYRLVSEPV
jgi:hypothetical protein